MNHPRFPGLESSDLVLQDVQANILKGHGRTHVIHCFIRWNAAILPAHGVSQWLKSLDITSATTQLHQIRDYKERLTTETVVTTVMLSYDGYRAVGTPSKLIPRDPAFRDGMKTASVMRLNEPGTAKWDKFYKSPVHCCISFACAVKATLDLAVDARLADFRKYCGNSHEVILESGFVMRDSTNDVIEHFGFRDGLSQPLFFRDEIDAYYSDMQGAESVYDPSANPYELVLVRESFKEPTFGSYCTFRKLEQDVTGFAHGRQQLAATIGCPESIAGALVVGRFEDGTATVRGHQISRPLAQQNNFDYSGDPTGLRCPFQSHIRKTNTRLPGDHDSRIARRGVSYDDGAGSGQTAGLLFMCFQADISRQFEKIQGLWINARTSSEDPTRKCGIDSLVALWDISGTKDHVWPQAWPNASSSTSFSFGDVVQIRGGEYFYAPSLRMLNELASSI